MTLKDPVVPIALGRQVIKLRRQKRGLAPRPQPEPQECGTVLEMGKPPHPRVERALDQALGPPAKRSWDPWSGTPFRPPLEPTADSPTTLRLPQMGSPVASPAAMSSSRALMLHPHAQGRPGMPTVTEAYATALMALGVIFNHADSPCDRSEVEDIMTTLRQMNSRKRGSRRQNPSDVRLAREALQRAEMELTFARSVSPILRHDDDLRNIVTDVQCLLTDLPGEG